MESLLEGLLPYENALLSDPDNEQLWLDYADLVASSFPKSVFVLDRAVARLPASSLLWNAYLLLPWPQNSGLDKLYRRALLILNFAPALWLRYLDLPGRDLASFDMALFNLDSSYHGPVWTRYIAYAANLKGKVAASVYARYFDVVGRFADAPSLLREYCVLKMAENGEIGTARKLFDRLDRKALARAQRESMFVSRYLETLQASPTFEARAYFEQVVADCAADMPEYASHFSVKLAEFFSSRGDFERARHTYSAALRSASTVRDVAKVFDAYSDWEEKRLLEASEKECPEFQLRLDKFESLLDSRAFLVNDVLIKSSPNLVDLWVERSQLYETANRKSESISTLVEAIKSINPLKAICRPGTSMVDIWVKYADIYIAQQDYDTATVIFLRAVKSQFQTPDDLAQLHIVWTEMLLLVSDDEALSHLEEVLFLIPAAHADIDYHDSMLSVQERLFKSEKLWSFYVDLLKAILGDNANVKVAVKLRTAYEKMMDLRIITLQLLVDYADFYLQRAEWARCCAVYELGIRHFNSAEARYHIWKRYISNVLEHEELGIEEVRDLFERCILSQIPAYCAREIFTMWSTLEEKNGSLTRSVKISLRALRYLEQPRSLKLNKDQLNKIADDIYDIYSDVSHKILTLKDDELYRETMSAAVQNSEITLPKLVDLALRYVGFETQKSEIKRARALLKHVAGLGPPGTNIMSTVWTAWENFELKHGTETTIREMLKLKRSVAKEYQTISDIKDDLNPMGFVKGEKQPEPKPQALSHTAAENPDAIEIDMDM